MQQLGCRTVTAYLQVVGGDQGLRLECERRLTVSISRFFRDRGLFEILAREILPSLVEIHPNPVKAWVAGCACGEEAYSLRIVWEAFRTGCERRPTLELLATDLHPAYIAKARAGIYPQSSLREMPADVRERYFTPLGERRGFAIDPLLQAGVEWRLHHLLDDPPGEKFQLVSLRNSLLTYYDEKLKVPALKKIVKTLAPPGFLIIGSHEKIPPQVLDLVAYEKNSCVFKRVSNTR